LREVASLARKAGVPSVKGVWLVFALMKRIGWRLSAFALMALLVRAIMPAGYMLAEAQTASGRYLTLELCDAHDGKPKLVDLDTGKIVDAPEDGKSGPPQPPCVCGAFASVAPPVSGAEPVTFQAASKIDFVEISDLAPGRGIAAPPPPSTGPPVVI
jgi:hypothetical protein